MITTTSARLRCSAALASLAGLGIGAPAFAEGADSEAERASDIVVIGKTYGLDVGKTVTPLKDVPNTITVITREQVEDQNLFSLEDALTATAGITVNGVGSEDPSFLSRGFAIDNYLVDGTPTKSFGYPAVVPDLFFYDRVEVLRGPAGLFSGSGNPAGSINLVRKRPLEEFQLQGALGFGSYDNLRAEVDLSTPISKNAAVRMGAMVQDQDQFYDYAHRTRWAAYATAAIDLGEDTKLTFGGTYDLYKPAIQSGLPGIIGGDDGSDGQLLDVPRSTYVGADWNRLRSETWTAFAEITHNLSDNWTLRASGLYSDADRDDIYSYIGNQPVTETNGVTRHVAYRGDGAASTHSLDLNLVGSFSLFGQDQTLIVGSDYQDGKADSYYTRLSNYGQIDIYNPVSPAEPPLDPYQTLPPFEGPYGTVNARSGNSRTKVEQYGLYGQIRLSPVESLTLVGGGRFTWWETKSQTLLPEPGPESGYKINGQFTPYAGVVWDVTDNLNLYGSYADSFTPQTSNVPRADGKDIEPLIGDQFEAGTKLSLMNEQLLLSLAAYQITQSNRLFTDADLPDVVFQIGKVRSRGIEAEANGQILPGWRVNGGYSYTKTKYLEDSNPLVEGISFVPVIPKHMVKLFTNYEAQDGALEGASLGAGLTWFSSTFGGNAATFNSDGTLLTRSSIVRQGAYAVVDLRAGYEFSDGLSLGVNVNNVLDKHYYSRISSTGRGNYYGSPRTVMMTLRLSFR